MEYEFERSVTREEAAATIQELGDGVGIGRLTLGPEDSNDGDSSDELTIDVPEEVGVELELEVEDGTVEVELELEWPDSGEGEAAAVVEELAESEGGTESEEPVLGPPESEESLASFEVFKDQADEWRWRLLHRNGNIIASSGEGYTRRHNAVKGLRSVRRNAYGAAVVDKSER